MEEPALGELDNNDSNLFTNFTNVSSLKLSYTLPVISASQYNLSGESPYSSNSSEVNRTACASSSDPMVSEFIIHGVILTIISVLGLLGNILSIVTFARMKRKTSFTCFLVGLSCCDSILVFSSILIFGLPSIFKFVDVKFYTEVWYPYLVLYLYPVAHSVQTGSVYFTLVVTIERYFAVCRPLQSRSSRFFSTWKRGIYMSIVIIAFSTGFSLPRWMEYRVEVSRAKDGVLLHKLQITALRQNPLYLTYYIHYAYFVVIFAIPIFMLVVFNSVIYTQIQKTNRIRQELSILQTSEINLALMLVCVVAVFLLCNILPLVNNLMELCCDVSSILIYLGNLLVAFNSSINFLIYYSFGERFRRSFRETTMNLCCATRCCGPMSDSTRKNNSSVYRNGEMNDLSALSSDRRRTIESRISVSVISNGSMRNNDDKVSRHPCDKHRTQSLKVRVKPPLW